MQRAAMLKCMSETFQAASLYRPQAGLFIPWASMLVQMLKALHIPQFCSFLAGPLIPRTAMLAGVAEAGKSVA